MRWAAARVDLQVGADPTATRRAADSGRVRRVIVPLVAIVPAAATALVVGAARPAEAARAVVEVDHAEAAEAGSVDGKKSAASASTRSVRSITRTLLACAATFQSEARSSPDASWAHAPGISAR